MTLQVAKRRLFIKKYSMTLRDLLELGNMAAWDEFETRLTVLSPDQCWKAYKTIGTKVQV